MVPLELAAHQADFDVQWPQLLEDILARLENNVRTQFPIPATPPSHRIPSTSPPPLGPANSSQDSQKENAQPVQRPITSDPPLLNTDDIIPESSIPLPTASTPQIQNNANVDINSLLPQPLTLLYTTICKSLKTNFAAEPPQTIQRLVELVLEPRRHYKYLPAYLRAVDRVVNIQSTTKTFPLHPPPPPMLSPSSMPNGIDNEPKSPHATLIDQLGSDESLGGALLTPIPWLTSSPRSHMQNHLSSSSSTEELFLDNDDDTAPTTESDPDRALQSESTEIVEGPHGAGRIETVSVLHSGTTIAPIRGRAETPPGDLEEMDVLIGLSRADSADAASLALSDDGESTTDRLPTSTTEALEMPHARGPSEIGLEDIGAQDKPVGPDTKLDLDAAVGRINKGPPSPEVEMRDVDVVDADGKPADSVQLNGQDK